MKIYIIGTSGCGKSTLAKQLAKKLNYPHIELDQYRFLPNWQKRNENEFLNLIKEKTKVQDWITCGNATLNLQHALLNNADTIIWLDYPFFLIFWRICKRTFKRILLKEPCCNGNFETFRQQFFSRDSMFFWVTKTFRQRRREYQKLLFDPLFGAKMLHINNPKLVNHAIKPLLST